MEGLRRLPQPRQLRSRLRAVHPQPNHHHHQRRYASAAAAIAPAPLVDHAVAPIARYPPTQPPSHKPPEFRKSQLLRSYASLLRSSPLILLFQHNNIRSVEWMALRREIASALRKLEESRAKESGTEIDTTISSGIKLQILQTGIFAAALRIVEFYRREETQLPPQPTSPHPTDPRTQSSASLPDATASPNDPSFAHALSRTAHDAVAYNPRKSRRGQVGRAQGLEPLLSGPLCAITFPTVTPPHVATLLRLLSPTPSFPAPRRRERPSYHEPAVQAAVQKLILLGASIEGRVFDTDGVGWVGGIQGGMDGLRARLVATLQGAGMGLAGVLDGAGRAVYGVMEGRRLMLQEEEKEGNAGQEKVDANGKEV